MKKPAVLFASLVAVLSLSSGTALTGKERAAFVDGIYAPGDGCKKLEALDQGTPKSIETVPDYLTPNGIESWEGGCEFTKVFEHDPGRSWVAVMVCSGGPTIAPSLQIFIKAEDGKSFEVAHQGQEEPEIFERCENVKTKED